MKRITASMVVLCFALTGFAQADSTRTDTTGKERPAQTYDTIRIGTMIIIRNAADRDKSYYDSTQRRFRHKNKNVTTKWWIVDLGFSQVNDKTDYAQAIASGFLPAGANEDWFNQRNFKSTNVNIWVFMQRLNLIKHVVNLKYGAGLELNNYKYTENIKFQKSGKPLVIMDVKDYRKNKLAADYITIPMMLNFNFTPNRKHSFGFSAGASAGYLYASRQKIISGEDGKKKFKDDFDLEKFKISYIGEITLGPIMLYGSYATKSMFENVLDQTPYNFGIRLTSW
jgi:hypothetical protein